MFYRASPAFETHLGALRCWEKFNAKHFPAHLQPDRCVEISPRLKAAGSQCESDSESFIPSVMDFFPWPSDHSHCSGSSDGDSAAPQQKKKILPYQMTPVHKSHKDKM